MSNSLITAKQSERELEELLKRAGVAYLYVLSGYDDALDTSYLRVVARGFNEIVRVPCHTMAYPIQQFSDEVLAPFVARLKGMP